MFSDRSLHYRIVLLTVMAVFLPLLVVGTYFCSREYNSLHNSNANHMAAASRNISNSINSWTHFQRRTLQHISNSPPIRESCARISDPSVSNADKERIRQNLIFKADTINNSLPQYADLSLVDLSSCALDKEELLPNGKSSYKSPDRNSKDPKRISENADTWTKASPQLDEENADGVHPEHKHIYDGGTIFFSTSKDRIGKAWHLTDPEEIARLNSGRSVLTRGSQIKTSFYTDSEGPMYSEPNPKDEDRDFNTSNCISVLVYKEALDPSTAAAKAGNPDYQDPRTPVAIMTMRLRNENFQVQFPDEYFYIVDEKGKVISSPYSYTESKKLKVVHDFETEKLNKKLDTVWFTDSGLNNGAPLLPLQDYMTFQKHHTQPLNAWKGLLKGEPLISESSVPDAGQNTNNKDTDDGKRADHKFYGVKYDKVYQDLFGDPVVGAWTFCRDIDWIVVSEMKQSFIMKDFVDNIIFAVIITAVIAAIFIAAAILTAQSLIYPINHLCSVVNTIADGKTYRKRSRCTVIRQDEIGTLANAFNVMADRVENAIQVEEDARKVEEEARKAAEIARAAAESARDAKSKFLASMSHELRTPLNAILGYTSDLIEIAQEDGDDYRQEVLQNIQLAGAILLDIINQILDQAKMEAGKMNMFVEKFPLNELVIEIKTMAVALARKEQNAFVLECDNSLLAGCTIESDKNKTKQSLLNLLSNAFKFTKKGTVTLRITTQTGAEAGSTLASSPRIQGEGFVAMDFEFAKDAEIVVLSVEDTGIGMTEEQSRKVFEAFVQADCSTTRNFGGTGLGLSLVRSFSQMLHFRLELVSQKDHGAMFTIKIPAVWQGPVPDAAAPVLNADLQAAQPAPAAAAVRDTSAAPPLD